jgi:mono/diheme cytochrome c family protein
MKAPSAERAAHAKELLRDPRVSPTAGEVSGAIYEATCVECHHSRRDLPWEGLPLSLSTGLAGESPRNLINVILHGLPPAAGGETTPIMPGYAGALDDRQVEALVTWMRANLTDRPPWQEVAKLVAESRKMAPDMLLFPPGGAGASVLGDNP